MKKFTEVKELVASLEADADKFYNKGNSAAGTRVRKGMQDLKNLAQAIRLEVQEDCPDAVANRLRDLLGVKAEELGMTIHALEVMPDHVHLFVESDPTRCVAEIVNRLKGYTSRVLRQEFPGLRSRLPTLWSRSYYAGSVGHVNAATVAHYIANQKGK